MKTVLRSGDPLRQISCSCCFCSSRVSIVSPSGNPGTTLAFSHFHTYKVRQEMNPEKTLLQQHELATYLPAHAVRPYGSTMLCGGMYIATRYAVCILIFVVKKGYI